MAIQFNCPYCTATIRVADEFAGKQGRCPKCETRLLIPQVQIPEAAEQKSPSTPESMADTAAGIRTAADQTSVGMHALEAVPGGIPEFTPAAPTTSVTSKLKRRSRRGRRHRIWMVAVPVLCFLLLISFLAAIMMTSLPDLSGTLTASVNPGDTLPADVYPWNSMEISPDDRTALQSALEKAPEAFASELMTCRLLSSEKGLEVRLKAEEGYAWFIVDPSQSKTLILWTQKHQEQINIAKVKELQSSLTQYCKDKLAIEFGERIPINAQQYRDSIGINIHVKALGYVLEAFGGNRIARCAHEDSQGRLYFLMPADTASFTVRGRTIADGTKPFPGEYTIQVAAAPPANDTPPKPDADDESKRHETTTTDATMLDATTTEPDPEMQMESNSEMQPANDPAASPASAPMMEDN